MYPIITISREVGSNGHKVGEMLAEKLGIPLLDRDFIAEVAKKTGFDSDKIEKKGEYFSQFEMYMNARFYNGLYIGDDQTDMFHIQKDIILNQAKEGPCVIVGRCADVILKEAGVPALNVFIHANMDYRVNTYKERFPETEDVLKLMRKKDKGRSSYYRFYTDQEWGDIDNYDLALDTSRLGLDLCVDMIIQAAKAMDK